VVPDVSLHELGNCAFGRAERASRDEFNPPLKRWAKGKLGLALLGRIASLRELHKRMKHAQWQEGEDGERSDWVRCVMPGKSTTPPFPTAGRMGHPGASPGAFGRAVIFGGWFSKEKLVLILAQGTRVVNIV
jgi:hypothetical protein